MTSGLTNEHTLRFSSSHTQIFSTNLNDMRAENDIKPYARGLLEELISDSASSAAFFDEDAILKLPTFASALFIWTDTIMKFVHGKIEMDKVACSLLGTP